MRLRDISLAARITSMVMALVVSGGLFWIDRENQRLQQTYLNERSADLEAALHIEKSRMIQSIETLRKDTLFLANVPAILGIVRAVANHGVDPRDKNSYAVWETRLQEIFSAFLRAHPEYSHVRFIGVADGGRELVRVNHRNDQIEVIQQGELQAKGDQDFFKAGLALSLGRVHLSEFTLNQEWGQLEAPYRPTLRAVTPVFDASGSVFGMVVLNLDVRPLLAASVAALPPGVQGYVADQQGHYLLHPDAKRAFTFELGGKDNIATDFPLIKSLFESQAQDYLALQPASSQGAVEHLAAERIYFDPSNPARFLLLAYRIPSEVIAQQSDGLLLPNLVHTTLVLLAVSVLFMLMLRYMFSPLRRIAAAATEIAAGNHQMRLSEKGGGEIGHLIEALNSMLDRLSDSELIKRENEFRKSIVATTHDGYWLVDALGNLIEVNQAYADMLGYTVEELVGKHISQLEAKERSADEVMAHVVKIIEQGSDVFETRHRHKDGHEVDVEVSTTFLPDAQKFVAFCRDITQRKREQLVMQRHKQVIETAIDGYWMTDADGYLEEVNEAYARISGYTRQELIGMHISQLEANEKPEDVKAHVDKIIAQGYDRFETKHRRKDGRVIDVEVATTYMPEEQKFFVFSHNITRRKQAEEEIRNLAFYDPLTQLPNRRLFVERLSAALLSSVRYGDFGAVLFIDLDNFKALNDTYGHAYGDLLLIEVAKRIKSCLREMDMVARFGGDEFVLLIDAICPDRNEAQQKVLGIAEKIRASLASPYFLKEHEYYCSPSIGVSLYLGTGTSVEMLLKQADMAMYQAKESGRNAVRFFDAGD